MTIKKGILAFVLCFAIGLLQANMAYGIDWEQWRIQDNSLGSFPVGVKRPAPDPRKAEAFKLNEKGNQACKARNWKEAIDYYKKALMKSPNDKVIRQNLTIAQNALAEEKERLVIWQRLEKENKRKRERDNNELLCMLGDVDSQSIESVRASGYLGFDLSVPKIPEKEKTGDKDLEAKKEQFEFENFNDYWMEKQKQLIAQRLKKPNKWCSGIHASLMGKVPPLPYKKFNELEAGDVLLFDDGLIPISVIDNYFSGDKVSNASHTVTYLKEVNGKKLFLDNQRGEGPRIISEDAFLKKYGSRSAEVARLLVGQPVENKETKKLFTAAVKMAQKNRNAGGTNYGVWGKDDLVCSEASWALLKATGRKIPKSDDKIKVAGSIYFSPADFHSQYFLVTPLGAMPKQFTEYGINNVTEEMK